MKLFSRHRDSVVGGMTRPQKIAVILFVVMTMFAIGFLIVATRQIKDRAERGEQYVTTIAPNSPTRFTARKYTDEPDQSYRDLYKLPTWAECNAPIDLR